MVTLTRLNVTLHVYCLSYSVWISEQTAIISLYNINWLISRAEENCVYGLRLNADQDLTLVPLCYWTISSGDMFPMSVTLSHTKMGVTHKRRTGYSHMKPLCVCPRQFVVAACILNQIQIKSLFKNVVRTSVKHLEARQQVSEFISK